MYGGGGRLCFNNIPQGAFKGMQGLLEGSFSR